MARASYYPVRLDDPSAVYFNEGPFAVDATGGADVAPALQAAINAVQESSPAGSGIVFVPSGTYRLGTTVDLWRGIRLIGYGPTRPRFVLGANTPGYQGPDHKYMIHFRDARPKAGEEAKDAQNTTFYSGVSNIDFEIGPGNPGAVCCRYRVAQLSSLEHIDFAVGQGKAAIEAVGNEIDDCRFTGGQYAIITTAGTSAGWQTLLVDCVFEGQRVAAIETERCGLIMMQCLFRNMPQGVVVREGKHEQLAGRCVAFDKITDAAMVFDGENNPANQLNFHFLWARDVPTMLRFRDTGRAIAGGKEVGWGHFHHGLEIARGASGKWSRGMVTDAPADTTTREAIFADGVFAQAYTHRTLPAAGTWRSVREFGARGDGITDDTAALQRAIDQSAAVYVPMGKYRLTGALTLRAQTALIGLHPERTELFVKDGEAGWHDPASPRALVHAPNGSMPILTGIGVYTGKNKAAVAVHWQAGADSLIDDVWFDWGGHGADRKGEDALYSLWVDGGAGFFQNIWSANILTRDGIHISDSPGPTVWAMISVEHHREVEVEISNSRMVRLWALQTEENLGSGGATSLRLTDVTGLAAWNYFAYRVIAQTAGHPHAIRTQRCSGAAFCGVHVFSWGKFPFDNALYDVDTDHAVAEREMGRLRLEA